MKYFLDTEFIEGTQKGIFNTKPTIDLISIGLVCEDGKEYYAISKDFNLKEAWNRYDEKINENYKPSYMGFLDGYYNPEFIKTYWLRDNVLKPIFREWYAVHNNIDPTIFDNKFTYREFKRLLNKYGKTNKQIAKEIKHFVANRPISANKEQWILEYDTKDVQFYGYYSDYDWVVFCWLFGLMKDLPKGFPYYCIDLKQTLDEKSKLVPVSYTVEEGLKSIKMSEDYPKQTNEHNALADARWNYELYKFLNTV